MLTFLRQLSAYSLGELFPDDHQRRRSRIGLALGTSQKNRVEFPLVQPRFPDSPEFGRLVGGAANVHLARVALEIASDAHPALDIESYLEKIRTLADRTRDRCRPGSKVRDILGQLNWVLFVEAGLRANEEDYYDPRNSYLNEVLDRGLGIPISLSLVYWAVGEQLGVALAGADLPLHFMLRFEEDGRIWFVDPFRGGAIYNRENCALKTLGYCATARGLD